MDMIELKEIAERISDNKHRLSEAVRFSDVSLDEMAEVAKGFLELFKCLPKIVDLHVVYQGGDDRSPGTPTWYFTSIVDAEDVSQGRGWYGGNACVGKISAIMIADQAYVLGKKEPIKVNVGPQDAAERRAAALAKLTEADKKILGIT